MNLFDRQSSPLGNDSTGSLIVPRLRMGLLTKLNLLTIGLLFVTAITTTGFYLWQQWRDENTELHRRGAATLAMLSELAEFGLVTNNPGGVDAILDTLSADSDVAYVVVLDAKREPIAGRRIGDSIGATGPPPLAADARLPEPGTIVASDVTTRGQRYLEMVAPIGGPRAAVAMGLPAATPDTAKGGAIGSSAPRAAAPIGYVRLGLTFDRIQQQFRKYVVGALSVTALLIVFAIATTFVLTRGLVAPMHRLMRAARSVGAGKLDVFVPASSSDELGLLTHTFNHMTQRLAESQAEVGNYQRTLEEKVVQRTKELEVATAHAYKLAQHDILTGLPNRALLNQR